MWARPGPWTYVFSIGRGRRGHVTSWSGKPAAGPQFPVRPAGVFFQTGSILTNWPLRSGKLWIPVNANASTTRSVFLWLVSFYEVAEEPFSR